jgi:RHS repeat-associated protein
VTESAYGVRAEAPRVFFPFPIGHRSTQWERGVEPMTKFAFSADYDAYGLATRSVAIGVPRGRDPRVADPAATQPYLATHDATEYARRDDADVFLVDRVARTSSHEVRNDGRLSALDLRDSVLAGRADLRVIGHTRTYYDGDAFAGLPLGRLGRFGLPTRSESLAFTDAFLADLGAAPPYLDPIGTAAWPPEYPEEFRALTPALAGYVHYGDGDVPGSPGGYYTPGARYRYDVHDPARRHRGLVLVARDATGAESRTDYDAHDLFAIRVTDPAGLTTEAAYDYRALQAIQTTDANGNRGRVALSPAGLVVAQFRHGRDGEGDHEVASMRLEYDLFAFVRRGEPASVRTVRRVHHDSRTDLPPAQRDEVLVSVEYSDGFGRLLQTRTQADDVTFGDAVFGGNVIPADQALPVGPSVGRVRPPGAPDNVVVSGWQVYDNKGRVVVAYEPFFSTGFVYAAPVEAEFGQRTTTFYDPRGQTVRTVGPDGSEQRVVFGVPVDLADPDVYGPTPWESYTYDANDNAGRTHGEAGADVGGHWNTPSSVEVDAFGRAITVVARNGPDPNPDWYVSRSRHDIQGNLVAITDALGRESYRYAFDLARRRWRIDSIDGGRRDTMLDALSRAVESRDSKGALTLVAHDALRRVVRVWTRDDPLAPVTMRERIEYGDGGTADQPADQRARARAHNLLGRVVRHYDGAGLVTVEDVDFKGNVVRVARRVIADAPILAAYERAATQGWTVTPLRVDWTRVDGVTVLLETAEYETVTEYDALNRPSRQVLPSDVEGRRRELRPVYDRSGGLGRLLLDDTVYVDRIAYDAKGQRALVAYGNGVMTRAAYDPRTLRLVRMRSERYTAVDTTYSPVGEPLQDYGYSYDPVGNLRTLTDRTPGSGIRGNAEAFTVSDRALGSLLAAGEALLRRFTYDPVYRLVAATGRECDAPPGGDPRVDVPRCADPTRARPYSESYVYDATGNFVRLVHAAVAGFTREFDVAPGTNRLARVRVGGTAYDYTVDPSGNLRSEALSRRFEYNHADQLVAFGTQTPGAEPSVHAQYLYDATGQRVKKLVRRQGGAVEVTHYIGEIFEHRRWSTGSNNHIHVMDDRQRIAIVRIGPAQPGDQGAAIQFHLADHLGSSTVVVDDAGAVTNREEFTPFGETSFGGEERKRYRFTGKERDEESGLSYHGARYLSPALGRWMSCDAVVAPDGSSRYAYVHNRPTALIDPTGHDDADAPGVGSVKPGAALTRLENKAGQNYGAVWSSFMVGGRGESGNLRHDALTDDQTWAREMMDRRWGCTLCHVSTAVWNEWGPRAFNPRNHLPYDRFIDRAGFHKFVVTSTFGRAIAESFVGAAAVTQGSWVPAGAVLTEDAVTRRIATTTSAESAAETTASRTTYNVTIGDVKSINDKNATRHLAEMEGREVAGQSKYNTSGQAALVYYDRGNGAVTAQIFSERPAGGGPRTVVFEGQIGRVEIPQGIPPIRVGNLVEEPVRREFSRWIGYEYPTKLPNAPGPDLHKPTAGTTTTPSAPARRGR